MDVVDFILNVVPIEKKDLIPTQVGGKLYKAAQQYLERDRSKTPQQQPTEELFKDDEEAKKILELRDIDSAGDLAWMEWSSWYLLPTSFRKAFESLVEPLFWSGIYFSYSRLLANTDSVLTKLGWASLFVYQFNTHYKVVIMTPSKCAVDYMGVSSFRILSDRYEKHKILSAGVTKDGTLKFNYFGKDSQHE